MSSKIVKSKVPNILILFAKKKDYLAWSPKNKLKALGGHQATLDHNLFDNDCAFQDNFWLFFQNLSQEHL